MPVLQPISPNNALLFKATRLQALQDSPLAFGSTFAKESQLTDAHWLKRAADWSTDRCLGYLALADEKPCGIVAAFLDENDPTKAHLVSMWVSPTHRRQGLGQTLINAMQTWAINHGAHTLQLTVTSNNFPAIQFYQQNGFTLTGDTEPYPNDPALFEHVMRKMLDAPF